MFGTNIGVDFGTSSIIIFVEGKGVVLNEPSMIAYDNEGKIAGIGTKAYDLYEKCPEGFTTVRPVENGMVSDFTAAKQMLTYFLAKVCRNAVFKPNVIMSVPNSVTDLEKRTMLDLITASGAAKACLIEETLAAALGAGVGADKHKGVLVIDIGGGSTDIAVITMGCISISESVKVGGDSLNEAIMRQLRRERDIIIGEKTAELLKTKIGSAILRDVELGMTVKGKNYLNNMPISFEVSSTEVYLAMRPQLEMIISGVKRVLEEATPDLAADILENGIYLTGGGAKLRSIDRMFADKLNIKVRTSVEPVNCVAMGIGEALSDIDVLSGNGYVFRSRYDIAGLDSDDDKQ